MKPAAAFVAAVSLLTPALAAPSEAWPRNPAPESLAVTPRASINQAEVFPFLNPEASCSILDCIGVIGAALCIIDAIDDDNWRAALECANRKTLCGCAGCISGLNRFLEKWGIC